MRKIIVDQVFMFDTLRSNSYFSDLPEDVLAELCLTTQLRSFQKGEILFWEGEPCAGLHIIRRGSVKLFKTSPQGRELILKVFEEGATFNEVPVFDGSANPVNVAALEDCEIWIVAAEAIRNVMERNPVMCKAVIQNLAANLRMLVELVDELSFYQVTHRLARLIGQLPPEQLAGDASQRITQDQMAARLGTVREVVARSLRELERSGAIRVTRRQIEILDSAALHGWSQTPLN